MCCDIRSNYTFAMNLWCRHVLLILGPKRGRTSRPFIEPKFTSTYARSQRYILAARQSVLFVRDSTASIAVLASDLDQSFKRRQIKFYRVPLALLMKLSCRLNIYGKHRIVGYCKPRSKQSQNERSRSTKERQSA
jgi:hypothetical protein